MITTSDYTVTEYDKATLDNCVISSYCWPRGLTYTPCSEDKTAKALSVVKALRKKKLINLKDVDALLDVLEVISKEL